MSYTLPEIKRMRRFIAEEIREELALPAKEWLAPDAVEDRLRTYIAAGLREDGWADVTLARREHIREHVRDELARRHKSGPTAQVNSER